MKRYIPLIFFLALVLPSSPGLGGSVKVEPLYNTPVYNPETKSYFAYVNLIPGVYGFTRSTVFYRTAQAIVGRLTFKGVHGRLAVVKSESVNDFLYRTFRPRLEAWIGLRYDCINRKLVWSDGTFFKPGDYSNFDAFNWAPGNSVDNMFCGKRSAEKVFRYVNVWYPPRPGNFTWVLKGAMKEGNFAFVEYPTGGK